MARDRLKPKLLSVFGTVVLMISCLFIMRTNVQAASADRKSGGRMLFISSYSYAYETVRMQIEGLLEVLGSETVLDYEFMDTRRVYDDDSLQMFYEGLKYRFSQVEPYDVVILGDDAALLFAMEHRDDLFQGVPLVFEGINNEKLALEAAKDPMITGVIERLSVVDNVKLGLKLNPQAVRVVAILDDSVTGKAERTNFYSYQDEFPDLDFQEINCSELTTEQLEKALRQVSKYSILIYILMSEDASGKKYSLGEAMQMIREYASEPALCMVETGIGEGLLGGQVVSMRESGKIAAEMALRILDGQDGEEIEETLESPNVYLVDQNVMKKYNLNMAALPEKTILLYSNESFFERNKEAMVPGILLVIALLVVIGIVCMDNVRGKRLQKELEEAKTIMESASQHDFLTGLPNRSKFMEDLRKTIDAKKPCTVIMLDIDDFKKINDTYGHTAGDEALKQVAARLKEMTSPILSAYRFAGDEFIMIQQSGQKKIVEKTAYQCRQLFSKMFVLSGEKRKICGSIGLACYPEDTRDLEQLIVYADDAMYQVKKNGKNDFAFYNGNGRTED